MKKIPLTRGMFALVDDANYDWLNQHKWQVTGGGKHKFYAVRTKYLGGGRKNQKSKTIYMHRLIAKTPEGMVCDHANGKSLDNRFANLRNCLIKQNCCNRLHKAKQITKYKGIYFNKKLNKWRAHIRFNKSLIHIGYYQTDIEAAQAYDNKALELFGEYAKPNFTQKGTSCAIPTTLFQQQR